MELFLGPTHHSSTVARNENIFFVDGRVQTELFPSPMHDSIIHLKTAKIRANLELNCNNAVFGLKPSLGMWFSPKKSCQENFHWNTLFWAAHYSN